MYVNNAYFGARCIQIGPTLGYWSPSGPTNHDLTYCCGPGHGFGFQNGPNMVPKWSQNGRKITQNYPKMVPKLEAGTLDVQTEPPARVSPKVHPEDQVSVEDAVVLREYPETLNGVYVYTIRVHGALGKAQHGSIEEDTMYSMGIPRVIWGFFKYSFI